MTIQEKLNELADLRTSLDYLDLQKREMIETILTPEIKAKIADIELEFVIKSEVATKKAELLETEIKEETKPLGETVKGNFLMAVYNKGRISWDTKAMDGYAVDHPEILFMRKEGEPSIAIRKI